MLFLITNQYFCLVLQGYWIKFYDISLSFPKYVLVLIKLCSNTASVLLSGWCIHIHQDKNLISDKKHQKLRLTRALEKRKKYIKSLRPLKDTAKKYSWQCNREKSFNNRKPKPGPANIWCFLQKNANHSNIYFKEWPII